MNILETSLAGHQPEFLAFARRRLPDPEGASDAVQESWLKAIKSAHTVRQPEQLKAWFYRILRHTITDIHRRRQREAERREEWLAESRNPSAETEGRICPCVHELLPTLNPGYAALLAGRDAGNKTSPSGQGTGRAANTRAVRLHRARRQLKARLVAHCQACATRGCMSCECDGRSGGRKG